MHTADRQRLDRLTRRVVKPLVFCAALLPVAALVAGAFQLPGFHLGANPIAIILHTCGKWALIFLLITLCVTPLRILTGRNEWLRLRRMLGLFAFAYALLHFLTYVILDRDHDLHAVIEDIAKRPYITIGFTALVLLVPLAVTSTGAMMRRLGRRWQRLHRLVYVIAVLGVWHYYWGVKADVRQPLIYAGILAGLFTLRWWRARSQRAPADRQSTSPPAPLRQNR
jgi:methionine sulfoxide reductase heme-binding subunit